MSHLRLRFVFGWCAMALLCAGVALGAGNYQPTKDGKTFVWNGTPRPGDTATWDGDRDKEGYATGFGSLTWYTARGSVFALYYGNMVHGKFEGLVNVHSRGKTGHAMFVDGERNSPWALGPAPSKMTPEQRAAVAARSRTENKPPAKPEVSRQKQEITSSTAEATPTPVKKIETEAIKPTPPAISEKKMEPGSVEDELRRTEPAREVRAAPASDTRSTDAGSFEPTPIPKSEVRATPALNKQPTDAGSLEPTPIPRIAETEAIPKASATETPKEFATEPIATPPSEPKEEQKTEDRSQQSQMHAPSDVSLNALTGPPSSLRTNPTTVETPPEPTPQPETKSPPPSKRGEAQLSESDAISAADAQVRSFGGDPDQYQRPKADYSAVTDKWTLFYAAKSSSLNSGPRSFTATVEDKTKKVELKK